MLKEESINRDLELIKSGQNFLGILNDIKRRPEAADLIMTDNKHLDNNPMSVTKDDVVILLSSINSN